MTATPGDRSLDTSDLRVGGWRAWLIFGLAALFFLYGFFQRVAPSVMVDQLMADFLATGAIVGNLSAVYYYAYASLQIPVGVMMDRWGPRRLVAFGILCCAGGTLIFSTAGDLTLAYTGRLLVGIGAGFSFVAALALAANWFPASRFAFFTGVLMMCGMLGGFSAQAPLAAVIEVTGWRDALFATGAAGLVLLAAAWLIIRDRPAGQAISEHAHQSLGDLARGLAEVLKQRQNWLIAIAGATCSAPMLSFAGLWGVPWLMQVKDLSRPEAAGVTSALLIGWAVGGPIWGWISDKLGRRKPPLLAGLALGIAAMSTLLYAGVNSQFAFYPLSFLAGAGFSCMVVTYALARTVNRPQVTGTVLGFVNGMTVAQGAIFQALLGWLLDLRWDGAEQNGARIYSEAAYAYAFSSLIAFAVIGFCLTLMIRERRETSA